MGDVTIEWVPGSWSSVLAGDEVQLHSDVGIISGRVRWINAEEECLNLHGNGTRFYRASWILKVVQPAVVLPTEPGFYITGHENPDVFELTATGEWYHGAVEIPERRVLHDGGSQLDLMRRHSDVVLEVLAEVKKSVLVNGFLEVSKKGKPTVMIPVKRNLDNIALQFGVTLPDA